MAPKILTVDDSRTIRMIVKKAFKPYECELCEAENGVEGLAMASKEKPDLIVLDITMPVMTGIEMLGKLKDEAELKEIPVIMLTAESGKDNVMEIVKMGVKDYMVKPFKGEQLIDRVMKIIDLTPVLAEPETKGRGAETNFFSIEDDIVILSFPEKITRAVGARIETAVKDKFELMSAKGNSRLIIDLSKVNDVSMTAIQLIISVVNSCVRSKFDVHLVARDNQIEALKGFRETSAIATQPSIEQAKAAF